MEVFAVDLLWLAPVGAVLALAFAVILAMRVLKQPEGNAEMKRISGAISRGANAYLTKQYKGVALFFFIVFACCSSCTSGICSPRSSFLSHF